LTDQRPPLFPLAYVVRKSAYEAYHGVIPLGLAGLIFTVLTFLLLPLLMARPQWAWALALFAVPAWAGTFAMTLPMAEGSKPAFRRFWQGVWRFSGRSLLLTVLYLAIALLTWAVFVFWRQTGGVLGLTFGICQCYAFAMFACAQIYTLPLMVRHDLPVMKAMAQSAKLFLAKPLYTVAVVVQLASLAVVLAVGTVALPLLYPGLAAVVISNAALNLTGELPRRGSAEGPGAGSLRK
jgi:uncharacterized membrane protein YesL